MTLPGGVPLVLVKIPHGTFLMGSPDAERGRDNSETQHEVTLSSDYYIGKTLVTQAQWQAVMGSNPSYFSSCGGTCPVENVSWNDIAGSGGFLEKLNAALGLSGASAFRLPTEAEWEQAARGGTTTRFSFGDALECDDRSSAAGRAVRTPIVWWCGNRTPAARPVGQKQPNPYGLYDVNGNVSEWVEDWAGAYPTGAVTDPRAAAASSGRAASTAGGGWDRCSRQLPVGVPGRRRRRLQPFEQPGFRLAKSQ